MAAGLFYIYNPITSTQEKLASSLHFSKGHLLLLFNWSRKLSSTTLDKRHENGCPPLVSNISRVLRSSLSFFTLRINFVIISSYFYSDFCYFFPSILLWISHKIFFFFSFSLIKPIYFE